MSYPFVGPVEVPTPTAGSHPTTKTYVDGGLAGKAASTHDHGATYATSGHNHDTAYATSAHNHDAAYAPSGHTHAHPLVPNPPLALTYSATLTPLASDGNYRICTLTGNVTLNPPTSPVDGQLWRIRFIASGGIRTVTLAAALRLPASIGTTLQIPSGRRGDVGLLYETADNAWTVLAAQAA